MIHYLSEKDVQQFSAPRAFKFLDQWRQRGIGFIDQRSSRHTNYYNYMIIRVII